jgi:hypothetical protein
MFPSHRSIAVFDRLRRKPRQKRITPATFGYVDPNPPENHPYWLALAAVLVIGLPYLPLGNFIMYPFFILTTWFHEMGHGLTALLVGMEFKVLVIEPNGSGYALTGADAETWGLTHALVSAGGPLGPAIAGSAMILASANKRWRRLALLTLGAFMILSTAIWVRSLVGWAVLLPLAALIIYIAEKASDEWSRFALQFLGVHAAISMFGQWGYLFSSGAVIGGRHQLSDTGAIADYLALPHSFWAVILIGTGGLIIGASLWRVLRDNRKG